VEGGLALAVSGDTPHSLLASLICLQALLWANKSDISYLKTSWAFDVLIHSGKPNSVDQRLCGHHEYLAARFWRFHSRSASRRRVYVASVSQYPSRSRNCGRLLIAATQSSCLNQLPKSTIVRSHGNYVCDVIIAHMISADAHTYIYIYRRGNRKVILGPAGHARSAATW